MYTFKGVARFWPGQQLWRAAKIYQLACLATSASSLDVLIDAKTIHKAAAQHFRAHDARMNIVKKVYFSLSLTLVKHGLVGGRSPVEDEAVEVPV